VLADKALGRVTAKDSTLNERIAAATVWAAMKTKTKKTTKKRQNFRILLLAKQGGALLFLLGTLELADP